MDLRVFLLLCVLGVSSYCDAREFKIVSVLKTNHEQLGREIQVEEVGKNENICTLCEEFTESALNYLADNRTQTEIIDILHQSCSKMLSFKQQCITLVDYYAPLFFLEISTIQPGEFCNKFGLCEQFARMSQGYSKDGCDLCHRAISEALIKLKDPDTQLEIIEILLKVCDSAENYAKKCKQLVFEYGPLILVNAEKFLEKNDVCTMLHACTATTGAAKQSFPIVEGSTHSAL